MTNYRTRTNLSVQALLKENKIFTLQSRLEQHKKRLKKIKETIL